MKKSLLTLNKHPHIWRASEKNTKDPKFLLGIDSLDTALNGGIAISGLIRVSSSTGVGELTLFKKVLCSQRTHKMVIFINPPGMLQTPWLENLGFNTQQVLVVNTDTEDDALWAAEQCLKSTACHCVVLWNSAISGKAARRLQVAAAHNDALCLLYTPLQVSLQENIQSLPIALDITLEPTDQKLAVNIKKQRHGWPVHNIVIPHSWTPDNHAIQWAMQQNKVTDQAAQHVVS
ncbi:recombinase RecA [Alteromonas sp. V450]|uniref:translesion DNA synthesis-associated protein ImuA n=1 Tax=Alteromonas sp. V450 TaxID=1912139 RepID=UPI0008FF3CF1|nr:translesion DNA synthesis-associated protein ImuA [Alteromonas sp. V450]OJF69948.1 recombinase RecA [Alteromonas sp. V450]